MLPDDVWLVEMRKVETTTSQRQFSRLPCRLASLLPASCQLSTAILTPYLSHLFPVYADTEAGPHVAPTFNSVRPTESRLPRSLRLLPSSAFNISDGCNRAPLFLGVTQNAGGTIGPVNMKIQLTPDQLHQFACAAGVSIDGAKAVFGVAAVADRPPRFAAFLITIPSDRPPPQ